MSLIACTALGACEFNEGTTRRAFRTSAQICFGSLADTRAQIGDVRLLLKSGHAQCQHRCPLMTLRRHPDPGGEHLAGVDKTVRDD